MSGADGTVDVNVGAAVAAVTVGGRTVSATVRALMLGARSGCSELGSVRAFTVLAALGSVSGAAIGSVAGAAFGYPRGSLSAFSVAAGVGDERMASTFASLARPSTPKTTNAAATLAMAPTAMSLRRRGLGSGIGVA